MAACSMRVSAHEAQSNRSDRRFARRQGAEAKPCPHAAFRSRRQLRAKIVRIFVRRHQRSSRCKLDCQFERGTLVADLLFLMEFCPDHLYFDFTPADAPHDPPLTDRLAKMESSTATHAPGESAIEADEDGASCSSQYNEPGPATRGRAGQDALHRRLPRCLRRRGDRRARPRPEHGRARRRPPTWPARPSLWPLAAFSIGLYRSDQLASWASAVTEIPRAFVAVMLITWPLFGLAALLGLDAGGRPDLPHGRRHRRPDRHRPHDRARRPAPRAGPAPAHADPRLRRGRRPASSRSSATTASSASSRSASSTTTSTTSAAPTCPGWAASPTSTRSSRRRESTA